MSIEQIHAAIPHRDPFLLVDEIVTWTDDFIACRKKFTGDEFFFRGHYPAFPLTPGVLLCEAGMQAGAILLSRATADAQAGNPQGAPAGVPVATRLNDVRFKKMVRPGDAIDIEVNLVERLANAFFLKAKVTCGGQLAARFEFACTLASPDALGGE